MKNIGDKVWIAWGTSSARVEGPCPTCFGRKWVHIVQGDGELWAVKCGECSRGCTPPTGIGTHHEARVGVVEGEVVGIEKFADEFRYSYSPHVHERIGIFETEEEAKAAAEARLPEYVAHREKIDAQIEHDRWDSSTWSLGYHRKNIKDAKRRIAYHEEQIEKLKEAKK